MNKIAGVGVASLLSVSALAGCGGSSSSSSATYCNDVKAASNQFKGLSTADLANGNLADLFAAVHKIAGEAPSDIKASWTVLDTKFGALKAAMAKAGVSLDDFGKLTRGDTSGIDPTKLAALATFFKNFDTAGIDTATKKITPEVKSECGFDLSSGSPTSSSPSTG